MERCANGEFNETFGKYTIDFIENIDGFKFHFKEGGYVMIRPSGTELFFVSMQNQRLWT